jgi:phosphonate transport system substrate-binding protein
MSMPRIPVVLFLAVLSLAARADEARPFELGVVPYLPTTRVVTAYQPLRNYLEASLKRPVVLSTAPSFTTFLDRCLNKEYDLVVLGPGLGRHIQTEAGYVPLTASKRNIRALIVTRRDAPYASLKDLAGKRIAQIEPMTGLSQLGRETLRQAGLLPERDYRMLIVNSPSNALQSVLHEEAEAGVITNNLLPQLGEEQKARLRILAESREIPGIWFLLGKNAGTGAENARRLLLAFERTDEGRRFVDDLAFEGLRPVGEAEMKAMDSFLPELRKR